MTRQYNEAAEQLSYGSVCGPWSGAQIGIVLTMPIAGLLCHYVNWDSVFYVSGQSRISRID